MTEDIWNHGRRRSSKLNLRQDEWSDYLKSLGNERFLILRQPLGIFMLLACVKDVVKPHTKLGKNSDGDGKNINRF
jgi:hypothetical protein